MTTDIKLNIQPQAGILGVFSRLNYKPWYAIGEFVDNSTASFFNHERTMIFYKIKKITIKINYDSVNNKLTIIDDAYGMELIDFQRAIKLDSKPENTCGRNEFGMGLKTAASWFGNVWSVKSTQLGSKNMYYAKVDILKLREENLNSIDIVKSDIEPSEHGTVITIEDVTKPINASRTQSKIKDLLASMYRRDIKSGKIEIYFNGDLLKFDEYSILKFRNREWKKDVDFSFDFGGKNFHVDGFVAIMAKGSFPKAGFSLFRYDRVVIGGFDQNYKPNEIFGQAQSQISLKLFGELNMEDFPVNQAKDGFVWDDGLEEEFLKNLKQNILEYINIANISSKARTNEEELSKSTSDLVEKEVRKTFDDIILDYDINEEDKGLINSVTPLNEFEEFTDLLKIENKEVKLLDDCCRKYSVKLNPMNTCEFTVYWKIGENDKWLEYNSESKEIIININHPFFKPYSREEEFKIILDKFVVAFISSEELAKITPPLCSEVPKGYVLPSVIRNNMNNILKKLSN